MTTKAIFERLYLIPGPRQFATFVLIPYAPTAPPLTLQLFLDFSVFRFFPDNISFFLLSFLGFEDPT